MTRRVGNRILTLTATLALLVGAGVSNARQASAPAASPPATPDKASAPASNPWLERANKLVAATPGTEDLGPVLLPAIAGMDTPPGEIGNLDAAMLLGAKSKDWKAATDWAKAGPQGSALTALEKVTDPKKKFFLGLPYSTAGVDAAWVKAGMCVDLPRDGLLAGAKFRYLAGFERLFALINVEATRLAEDGKVDQAMVLMIRWVRLNKALFERESVHERRWAMGMMEAAGERIRDIVYTYRDKLTAEVCRVTSDDLDERLIQVQRLRLPAVERIACEQLAEKVIKEKGEVDAGKFAATLARLQAGERPLTLFGEAAFFRDLAGRHAGWFDTKDQIRKVFDGWQNRWQVEDLHDKLLEIPSDFAKMDKAKFALIDVVARDIELMQGERLHLYAAMGGTRMALGCAGYERKEKVWPPNISAIAPKYVRALDNDPYNYDKKYKALGSYHYRVPIRDDPKSERVAPQPHEMTVGVGKGKAAAPSDPMLEALAAGIKTGMKFGADKNVKASDLDFDGMLADIDAAKKSVVARAGEVEMSDSDLAALTEAMKIAASMPDANVEMLRGLITAGIKKMGPQGEAMLSKLDAQLGVSFDSYLTTLSKIETANNKVPEVQELRRVAGSGGKLTLEQVKKAYVAGATALTSDTPLFTEYLQMMSKMMKAPIGREIRKALGINDPASPDNQFTVTITDKQFLLYSVDADMVDGRARSVGTGGSDILYWPPVLSLRREHAN